MTNPTHCDKCGTKIEKPDGSCGTGYARVSPKGQDGPYEYHCYDCCNAAEIDAIKDRSGFFSCYLNCDGTEATTWPGGKLGDVVSRQKTSHAFGRSYSLNGDQRFAVQVKDVHGAMWHGKGYAGCCINLYPMKG